MQGDQHAVANPHSSGGVQHGPKEVMRSQLLQSFSFKEDATQLSKWCVDDSEDNALEENLNDIEMINIDLIR